MPRGFFSVSLERPSQPSQILQEQSLLGPIQTLSPPGRHIHVCSNKVLDLVQGICNYEPITKGRSQIYIYFVQRQSFNFFLWIKVHIKLGLRSKSFIVKNTANMFDFKTKSCPKNLVICAFTLIFCKTVPFLNKLTFQCVFNYCFSPIHIQFFGGFPRKW